MISKTVIAFTFIMFGSCTILAHASSSPKYDAGSGEPQAGTVIHTRLSAGAQSTGPIIGMFRNVDTSDQAGTIVGYTFYDLQHGQSTGRQIDEADGEIQVTFTGADEPELFRSKVRWNRVPVIGSPTPVVLDNGDTLRILPLGAPLTIEGLSFPDLTGSTTFRLLPDRRGVALYHTIGTEDTPARSYAAVDATPGNGAFNHSQAPQPLGVSLGLVNPHSAVGNGCGDTVLHAVARGIQEVFTERNPIWYWRASISGTTINWDPPIFLDTAFGTSAIIETWGDRVAIVYIRIYAGDWDRDVVYRLSTDCGTTWAPDVNVTSYTTLSDERALWDLDAVFDEDGVLHLTWSTRHYDSGSGLYSFIPCHLNHWNSQRSTIRRVTSGDWNNRVPDGCSEWGRNGMGDKHTIFTKMNLAVKPTGDGPGNGMADELLYAVWVQGGPTTDDCATKWINDTPGGVVNTEIYWSVSSNDGLTWDRPINLTGTETPECLPGDCHSEHWVTAAARADSAMYISYTDDTHAGVFPFGQVWQGAWSESPYRVMAVETRAPVLWQVISVDPETDFIELNADTTGTQGVSIEVMNLGNATLDFNVVVTNDEGGLAHVLVNGGTSYNGSVLAGGSPEIVTIQYDGIGLSNPSEHNWRLEITSNDETNDPGRGGSPIDISLNVFVASPWFTCTEDSISNATYFLSLTSCLELGNKGEGGGFRNLANGAEWIFDMSPVLAWNDGGGNLAYRDMYWELPTDRSRDSNRAFRAQSLINVSAIATGADAPTGTIASGTATSTDSIFQIGWTVTMFDDSGLTDGFVTKYTVTNRTGESYSGIHLGVLADLDVDSLSTWNDGIASEEHQYIGAQGGYSNDTTGFTPQSNFAAIFYQPLDSNCSDLAAGGQVLDNADYVYPEGAYNTDSVYRVISQIVGWESYTFSADTISDINVVLANALNQTLGPNDTLEFAFGYAVSSMGAIDLRNKIVTLRAAANLACSSCLIELNGDVNETVTITSADIISLVSYVFRGGPPPEPCEANGDVNCSGSVTSADIIYLVGFVFKGGTQPCDICNDSPLSCT